jgi:ketosteroid isomerase-like protein
MAHVFCVISPKHDQQPASVCASGDGTSGEKGQMITTEAEVARHLTFFSSALEKGDVASLLTLYDENAQLSVSFCATSDRTPRVVRGKSSIAPWMTRLISGGTRFRVVNQLSQDSETTVIAEVSRSDGSRAVIACRAQLVDGLVAQQFVVMV